MSYKQMVEQYKSQMKQIETVPYGSEEYKKLKQSLDELMFSMELIEETFESEEELEEESI